MPRARPIPAAFPTAPLRVNASLPLMVRLEELVWYDSKVRDPANEKEAHDMRIAVKRLRYTLEIFAMVVEGSDGYLKTLKGLQSDLGALHDADVLIPLLRTRLEGAAEEDSRWEKVLLDRALAERERLYCQFIRRWDGTLEEGFPARLWDAAFAASACPATDDVTVPAGTHEQDAESGPLPPKSTRRVQKAVALLRLAPYAVPADGSAGPRGEVRRLRRAMKRLGDAALDGAGKSAYRKASRHYRKALAALADAGQGDPADEGR